MTEFQNLAKKNAAIRGYIMRMLVKGTRNCMFVRRISDALQKDGYTMEADIAPYLSYLHEMEFIKFLKPSINPYNAYAMDAVVGLSYKGLRFMECGDDQESGIEL